MSVIDFYCFTQRHTNLICKAESTLQFATYFFFNFDNRLEETSNGCRNRLKSRQHIKKLEFHVKIRHPKISMAWHHWRSKAGVSFGRVAWIFSLSLLLHPGNGHFCKEDDEEEVHETMHSSSVTQRLRLLDMDPSTSSAVWKVTVMLEVSAASHTPDDDGRSLSAAFSCTIGISGFE